MSVAPRSLTHGLVVSLAALLMSGCAMSSGPFSSATARTTGSALQGSVHGGQQPVTGATIQLYAASTSGYGAAATPLLNTTVITDANGGFNLAGDYSCTGNPMVYLVATGGNPGLGAGKTNANLALMVALGSCTQLQSTAFVSINELTTVASAYALAPFMTGTTNLGSSSTNTAGLTNAFATVNNLVNTATGWAPGPALPSNASVSLPQLNSLADIVSSCVNSAGGTSGDGSSCGNLFSYTQSTATDTIGLALYLAKNPQTNVANFFSAVNAQSPFQPTPNSAPANWAIAINYQGGGLNAPQGITVDGSGNIWTANPTGSSVSEFANNGQAISPATGYAGLQMPEGIAADATGNIWIAEKGDSALVELSSSGSLLHRYTGAGLNAPSSVALDAAGNIWLGNTGSSSVSASSSTGTALSSSGYATVAPVLGLAINPH